MRLGERERLDKIGRPQPTVTGPKYDGTVGWEMDSLEKYFREKKYQDLTGISRLDRNLGVAFQTHLGVRG